MSDLGWMQTGDVSEGMHENKASLAGTGGGLLVKEDMRTGDSLSHTPHLLYLVVPIQSTLPHPPKTSLMSNGLSLSSPKLMFPAFVHSCCT